MIKRKRIGIIREKNYIHNDEYYYSIVRKNVKKYRTNRDLTQQDLADMTGLSREYICDIENEKRKKHPSLAVIGRISDALLIDISKIFIE